MDEDTAFQRWATQLAEQGGCLPGVLEGPVDVTADVHHLGHLPGESPGFGRPVPQPQVVLLFGQPFGLGDAAGPAAAGLSQRM